MDSAVIPEHRPQQQQQQQQPQPQPQPRQLSKHDTAYAEMVDYCQPEASGELAALRAWGTTVKEGLLQLHAKYEGRWARFPVETVSRYGEGDYCHRNHR
jgi:hypothetical protein